MSHDQLFWLYTPITILLPFALTAYVGSRLLSPIRKRSLAYAIAAACLLPMGLLSSLALIFWGELDLAGLDWLVEPGFFCLGFLLTLLPGLLLVELIALCLVGLGAARKRLFYATRVLVCVASLGCSIAGLEAANAPPAIASVEVPISGLGSAFDGYRIVQLTDIHLRGRRDEPRLAALVRQTNALRPDLIAITGDIVDGPVSDLRRTVRKLADLRAKDGVFVVLGNHEFYADAEACAEEFKRLGLQLLLDEHRVISRGTDTLVVAGVTNPQNGMHGTRYSKARGPLASLSADPRVALATAPPSATRLLLAHQPKSAQAAADLGVSLALVGHTHGGQFFPFTWLSRLIMKQVSGLYVDQDPVTFVGRGLGTFGPRSRLGAPPELPLLTLRRAP